MSKPWDSRHIETLTEAVDVNDMPTVRELIQNLVAHVYSDFRIYPENEAGDILNVLRHRRHFDEMREAADAFLNNGCSTFRIRKYYAQALLDLGYLAAAENVLKNLQSETRALYCDPDKPLGERTEAEKQWAEACGLLGRLHKDRYVNAHAPEVSRNRDALNSAIAHYYDCYTADDNKKNERHWHGINAVALARLARRHGIPVTKQFDVLDTAETILKELTAHRRVNDVPIDPWATAIAMEASIALNQWDDAYKWAKEYVDPARREGVDAFEISGTLRQLQQVWELDIEHDPGRLLVPLLRTRLMQLEGFSFQIAQDEPVDTQFLSKQANSLEAQFGGNFLSFRVYYDGVSRARAVARIGPSAEEHFGTGFLVDGADLDARLDGQQLLITCDHVVSNTNLKALRPNRARVTFRSDQGHNRECGVQSVLWSRPEGNLDVSILCLDGDVSDLPNVLFAKAPPGGKEQRVLVFGHAEGGALSFSLGDNRLVDWNDRFFQYRAPTVKGNSGSPVCNSDWELIAVHHLGGYGVPRLGQSGPPTVEANQGSSIFAIQQAIRQEPVLKNCQPSSRKARRSAVAIT